MTHKWWLILRFGAGDLMGRPALYGQPMTAAERKAAQVARRLMLLESARASMREALGSQRAGKHNAARMLIEAALKDLDEVK